MMDEISQITDYIQDEAGLSADIIWGTGRDEELGDNISITLIATGFEANKSIGGIQTEKKKEKVVHNLKKEQSELGRDQSVKNTFQANEVSLEPELKTFDSPKVEQVKMDLDIPIVEKSIDVSENHDESIPVIKEKSLDNTVDPPKIVHNLYEEDNQNKDSESQFDNETVSEESAFNFESPLNDELSERTKFEPTFHNLSDTSVSKSSSDSNAIQNDKSTFAEELDAEERLKRSQQRLSQLNNLTGKLKSPSNISDLEDEPAYVRKKVRLDNIEHSSENKESRFTLGNDSDNNPEIRSNNSFLHDNVD